MASYPLVAVQDDLGALVELSLCHHHVPLTAVFDVFEELTRERFFAVSTPLLDERGAREAYFKIFTAFQDETFSTQTFLRLHTLVISQEELQEIRQRLRRGSREANLFKLAHLCEVTVRPIGEPKSIMKSGMLHINLQPDGAFRILFMSLDGQAGHAKPRILRSMERVTAALERLNANGLSELDSLRQTGHASILAMPSLESLYTEGLI
jgi:hypothetical protein